MPERFVCTLVQKALYKYSSFPFLYFMTTYQMAIDTQAYYCANF